MSPVWVAFVAACSALLATAVAPFVTLAISRRQFRANVVAVNREKWIGTVRETTAEFIALGVAAGVQGSNGTAHGHARVTADPALLPKFERIVQVRWNLRLLLNPTEPSHIAAVRAVDAVAAALLEGPVEPALLHARMEAVASATQVVIREAWQRVKSGT